VESIKTIYKIGVGPSSSHTIAPTRASGKFKQATPDACAYRVSLFGSLAATGKGHMTDKAIQNALAPIPTEIVWKASIVPEFHTNGMLFESLDAQGNVVASHTFYSVGGGDLADGPALDDGSHDVGPLCGADGAVHKEVYKHSRLKDIRAHMDKHGVTYWETVEYLEGLQVWDYLRTVWNQMQATIEEGLSENRVIPGGLCLKSKARNFMVRASGLKQELRGRALVAAYALAAAEQNARGGIVVTAPTCGSCGVLPGVLYHLYKAHGFSEMDILRALATAGLFASVIKYNASLSGAEVGCQGEVGSACVMAAVAACQLFGGTDSQIECAAEMAMEHNLGLTCDPICGLVQIPCIERNSYAALRALDVSMCALLGDGNHLISFDKVIDAMGRTGKDLPSIYKETALGGLAALDI